MVSTKDLIRVANLIAENSGGRIVLFSARNRHWLSLDGERMGMVIEDYSMVSGGDKGDKNIFLIFFNDFFLPLRKNNLTEAFKVAGLELKKLGDEAFRRSREWAGLFDPEIPVS